MIPIWVPLALAAASFGANYAGQKKTDKARAAALDEARRLREQKSRDAETAAKRTADLFGKTTENEQQAAVDQEQRYNDAAKDQPTQAALADILTNAGPSATTTFVEEAAHQGDKSKSRLAQRAKSLAALNAFSDVMVGNEIASATNRADIGQAGASMQAWNQNVLPMQLDAANAKGRDLHTLADALQAASMLTGIASMTAPAAAKGVAAKAVTAAPVGPSGVPLVGADAIRLQNNLNWLNQGYGNYLPAGGIL